VLRLIRSEIESGEGHFRPLCTRFGVVGSVLKSSVNSNSLDRREIAQNVPGFSGKQHWHFSSFWHFYFPAILWFSLVALDDPTRGGLLAFLIGEPFAAFAFAFIHSDVSAHSFVFVGVTGIEGLG